MGEDQSTVGQVGGRASLSAMPVQRGNYGIPPRQPMQQPAQTFTDIAPPRPAQPITQPVQAPRPPQSGMQPQPTFAQPVAPPQPVQQPIQQPTASPRPAPIQPPQPISAPVQPIFQTPTAAQQSAAVSVKNEGFIKKLVPKLQLVLLIVGVLLLIGGGARYMTAPNIDADTIAVGAVAANDGRQMTIQFTADDGKMHKLNQPGNFPELKPGSAVQIAYRAGAPDTTAKRVDQVKSVKSQGLSLLIAGGSLLSVGLVVWFIRFIRNRADGPKKVAMATTA